ncbi:MULTISPECIES: 3-hydroxyisobutyryl-CoA hydrolase [Dermacoccus]|uniref:3-hydroxyisobutyryl-CoA hydrolase n=2 Tax=Dermacoccus TaxID=57495 RepID=A0A417Z3N0_9MICO|nr:3-hydroxyisobutyryl-CoA hydrolase [Dermacoccus abyssi]RHW45176.1 enoyl-CoA hydratase/isomerase family protein [Dermacoccus abyssi]
MSTQEISEELAAAGFAPTSTPEVLAARTGSLARIMLNRPKAINALTTDMVDAVRECLDAWRDDDSVTSVTIEGAGERGLCAGGDVRGVREAFLEGEHERTFGFFEREYRMNAAIADYPKLVVSYQDGIVMGGGVGISSYAGLRVATERTKVAMPETIIGFFPDVGALYLLSRAPGGTGAYLALTGTTVDGHDSCYVALSDVVIDSTSWPTVLERLADGASRDDAVAGLTTNGNASLEANRAWIDDAFGAGEQPRTPSDVLAHLRDSDDDAAREAADLLVQRSPLSVAATLEALRRAAAMDSVHEVLEQDKRLARGLVEHGDFVEGVRAQLVDKDRSPKWSQKSFDDITDEQVARLFA